ncbi:Hypothetical predicted protein [Paramuricea clavata]|uniref:Uncharacterized protein n=1 Tax=Paramuricea clavata TaxID=317549 RepID=A0A6S7GQU2_PARCT|nr:Hypothetical predicted protein [Paramuricea clavata]
MRKKIGNQEKEGKSNKLVEALEAVQSDLASLKEAFNKSQISGKDASKQDPDQWSQCKKKSTLFKKCQESEKHWGEHKTLCKELSHLNEQNIINREVNKGTYVCNLSPKEGATVARLVGKKYTVKCFLNGVESTALWDTGAQVSIVYHDWVLKNLPKAQLRTVETLLGASHLDLKAANGTTLPYDGWMD